MSNKKIVEIISVGTELLLGNIVNTNAAFLAGECARLGLYSYYQTVVGDNKERLLGAIKTALSRADIVILGGGLGPTEDDLTKETACEAVGVNLTMHEESMLAMVEYFKLKGLELTSNNYKQALMPEGGIVLKNHNGTAPGAIIQYEDKHIILLPGPPNELVPMFKEEVVPYLRKLSDTVFVSKTVKIVSVGESILETRIKDLIDAQTNPTIATYAKTGEVHVRITAEGKDTDTALKLIDPYVSALKERFGDCVYAVVSDDDDEMDLPSMVAVLLASKGYTVKTAEYATDGLLSQSLADIKLSSEIYKGGIVVNSKKALRKLAGVKKSVIEKYGPVSRETALEMAVAKENSLNTEVTLSLCGDTDNEDSNPVYVAVLIKDKTFEKEFHFKGGAGKIKQSAVNAALVFLRECLMKLK